MINRVIIDGFIGRDVEIRKTQNGKSVCNISICQTIKDRSGNQTSKWFNISAWEKTADYLGMYCKKGDLILVEGRADYHEYEKDGYKRRNDEIVAEKISIERFGQNHQAETPQIYREPVAQPTYTQQSIINGQTVPSEIYNGIDISADDLPF